MKTISNPTTQLTKYGSYTTVSFDGNFRQDLYRSKRSGESVIESVLCLNSDDLSPVQTERTLKSCHCCFAGYAHTVALCNDRNKISNQPLTI